MPGTFGAIGGVLQGGGGGGGDVPDVLPNYTSPLLGLATSVSVVTGATAHTKGAWTELFASLPGAANLFVLYPNVGANGVDGGTIVDIAVGAVGAEVILAQNVVVGGISTPYPVVIPIGAASGARVSMRTQGVVVSRSTSWTLIPMLVPASAASSDGTVDVLGANTATTKGVIVQSSSGWVEVVSSTTRAYRSVILVPSVNALTNPSASSFLRAGKGASGSEVELGRIYSRYSNTENLWTDTTLPSPLLTAIMPGVPAGTRLSVATSSAASMCACLIGVPA